MGNVNTKRPAAMGRCFYRCVAVRSMTHAVEGVGDHTCPNATATNAARIACGRCFASNCVDERQ